MVKPANEGLNGALERQVERVQLARRLACPDHNVQEDREFTRLLDLLGPRIRYLVRLYRLMDWRDDAEQVCAIAVLRAVEGYNTGKARFTTHVTWQLRGELQSLRHRVRLDQRRSARSAGISTVHIEGLKEGGERIFEIVDDASLARTEAGASDAMTLDMLEQLLDQLGSPQDERAIVREQIMERERTPRSYGYTNEQRRQITRRTYRNCAKVMATQAKPGSE